MPSILIEGSVPLVGTVTLSGAKNSALKIIPASMFSNEDVVLENVPKIASVLADIEMIKSIGGKADWIGNNRLMLNGSEIKSFEIPFEIGSRYRTTLLLAGPLLFRFGKAFIPKFNTSTLGFAPNPINRLIDTWKSFGISIEESKTHYLLSAQGMHGAEISFKTPSHMGTDNAILIALFTHGDTTINNASEESEVDDLIEFCTLMGGNVTRVDPQTVKISGRNIFKGCNFEIEPDKMEAATFAAASVLTRGNITIRKVKRTVMIPFVNFLAKIGARFEFSGEDLKVWSNDDTLSATQVIVSPTPGFIPDWKPLATLILTQADGKSLVHDTVYFDRNDFIKDLNRMGAKIEPVKPSTVGIVPVISNDSYSIEKSGEPETVLKINGPTKLRNEKINVQDMRYGALLVLAALAAEGKSEIGGYEYVSSFFENFFDKLTSLGARIWVHQD